VSPRAAPPRVLFFAVVAAIHAGVLALLIAETRSRLIPGEAEAPPLLVMLLPAQEGQRAAAASTHAPGGGLRYRAAAAAAAEIPAPAAPAAPDTAIDWAAQGLAAAASAIEENEQRARQARALAPKASPIFAAHARRPEFHWDYARTHRVEALPGLATAIHLNDECAIVLFLIVPFAGGCALEKAPARGDLFEHMHDPEPAPDP
jgi:hypothetical protein